MRYLKRGVLLASALLVTLSAASSLNPRPVNALSGSEFSAGRIIDDVVFTNKDAMSVAQIQAFLNAKVPVCDINRPSSNPSYQPPYTCLKDYQENPTTLENNYGRYNPDGNVYQVPGGKSAAQIIWDAGQKYNINPQVILVTLQKEQSLVTDDWPWSYQYWRAMGNHCPDGPGGAQCDPAYAGFYNQVDGGTWQFRHDLDGIGTPGFYSTYKQGWNNILYQDPNTNPNCGTKSVFIENQATAVLYKYTPYTPNQAALDNLYGQGDSCSAYGNRNFWRQFNDWFGSTIAPYLLAQPVWQSIFTDSTKATPLGWGATLVKGRSAYAVVVMKNIGNTTWTKSGGANSVMLGTQDSQDRQSAFCTGGWLNPCSRLAFLNEATVAPGSNGTFEFPITAPQQTGSFKETFGLVVNGQGYFPSTMNFPINVEAERNSSQPVWQGVYTDSSKSQLMGWNANLLKGQSAYAVVIMKNTGNTPWTQTGGSNDVMLGTVLGQDRQSAFCTSGWLNPCNRPVRLKEASVAPGSNGTFEFPITAPQQTGSFNESFGLVVNGKGYFPGGYMNFQFNVEAERNSSQPVWQGIFSDSTKAQYLGWNASLLKGQSAYAVVVMKNTGNIAWTRTGGSNDTMLGTVLNQDRQSVFCTSGWLNPCNRPVSLTEATVAPGGYGTFEFPITAPQQTGSYSESFGLVVNGKGYFPGGYMNFQIASTTP